MQQSPNSVNFREHYPLSFQFPVNVQNNLESHASISHGLATSRLWAKGLLNQLGFSINAEEQADWPLLKSGAGNPLVIYELRSL
jgi:serine/threonine-protein kinase HipA